DRDSIRILAAHWLPVVGICNAYRPLSELPKIAARPHILIADIRDFRLSSFVSAGHIPHARRHRALLPVFSRPGSLLSLLFHLLIGVQPHPTGILLRSRKFRRPRP